MKFRMLPLWKSYITRIGWHAEHFTEIQVLRSNPNRIQKFPNLFTKLLLRLNPIDVRRRHPM